MSNHQDMGRRQAGTQASASARLALLTSQGHHANVDGDANHVTVTLTRKEGYAGHVTFKPDNLPDHAKATAAFKVYPQSVLLAYAVNAIAEWSQQMDLRSVGTCLGCTTSKAVTAFYNQQNDCYDWLCPNCFYGEAA